jgi:hypothetical protein
MANKYAQGYANKKGSSTEKCPIGMHEAMCIEIVELGEMTGQYGKKYYYKFAFEVFNEKNPSSPYVVGTKKISLSLYEKGNLAIMLKSWRGKAFTSEEVKEYEQDIDKLFSKVVGVGCMINVVEEENKKGGDPYHNIENVLPLKKDRWFTPVKTPLFFNLTDDLPTNLEKQKQLLSLPKWIVKDMYEEHTTVQKIYATAGVPCPTSEALLNMLNSDSPQPQSQGAPTPTDDVDDSVPF